MSTFADACVKNDAQARDGEIMNVYASELRSGVRAPVPWCILRAFCSLGLVLTAVDSKRLR